MPGGTATGRSPAAPTTPTRTAPRRSPSPRPTRPSPSPATPASTTARRTGRPAPRRASAAWTSARQSQPRRQLHQRARRHGATGRSPAAPTTPTRRHGGDRHHARPTRTSPSPATPAPTTARRTGHRHRDGRRRRHLGAAVSTSAPAFTDVPGGTATWTFAGGANYIDQSGTAAIVISQADATVTVNGYTGSTTRRRTAPPARRRASAARTSAQRLTSAPASPTCPAARRPGLHRRRRNYIDAERHARPSTSRQADATVDVNGYTGVYDARRARRDRHGDRRRRRRPQRLGSPSARAFTDVPGGTANWSFAGGANYTDQTATPRSTITPATATDQRHRLHRRLRRRCARRHLASATGVGGADLSARRHPRRADLHQRARRHRDLELHAANYISQTGTAAITSPRPRRRSRATATPASYDGQPHGPPARRPAWAA